MKAIISFFVFLTIVLFSGCYSIVSIQEESEDTMDATTLVEESSVSYFDEETFTEETDSGNDFSINNSTLQEEETGFFETFIAEVIAAISNISNNHDDMIMLYCGDAIFYVVISDNPLTEEENSSTNLNPSSTRNIGYRNHYSRK